jgi:hypothetical protein
VKRDSVAAGRSVGRTGGRVDGGFRWSRVLPLTLSCLSLLASTASAQSSESPPQSSRPTDRPSARPPGLTVYLMTMGPGKAVWERFGHNAIWVHDPVRGTDQAYNYGLFDLRQEKFLVRFLQGRMWYWMQGFPAQSYVETYRRANRSVWIQELEMTPSAKRELQQFLEWNERPENRFYHYDYYRDNCSTRVRDALDRALGQRIQDYAVNRPTGKTYRSHTQRLTANDPLVYTGLLIGLGHPVDREISAWDEMFLPLALREHMRNVTVAGQDGREVPAVRSEQTLFESSAPVPPADPPFWLPAYLGLGVLIGAGMIALGIAGRRSRRGRAGFLAFSLVWTLLVGVLGLLLAGLWALTDHTAAYWNENLLQLNPIALALLPLLPRPTRAPGSRLGLIIAALLVGLSVAGLLLKALPGFSQVNGEIIALALPIHLGLFLGAWQMGLSTARLTSRAASPREPRRNLETR